MQILLYGCAFDGSFSRASTTSEFPDGKISFPGAKRRVLSPCTCTFLHWGTKFLTRM